jgi:protein-S-isoprenylcysteine O-methyltransferase Ste14
VLRGARIIGVLKRDKARPPLPQRLAAKFRHRRLSDWVGFVFFLGFGAYVWAHTPAGAVLMFPSLAAEVLAAIAFVIRRTPTAQDTSWYARTIAFPVFTLWAGRMHPLWLAPTSRQFLRSLGSIIFVLGSLFGLWALWWIKRSFSIEPEARELVTGGPYAVARHPMYLSFTLQTLR